MVGQPVIRSLIFPFLFGGTFIEGSTGKDEEPGADAFPFLFGGTFIEGSHKKNSLLDSDSISLPFRRDFH